MIMTYDGKRFFRYGGPYQTDINTLEEVVPAARSTNQEFKTKVSSWTFDPLMASNALAKLLPTDEKASRRIDRLMTCTYDESYAKHFMDKIYDRMGVDIYPEYREESVKMSIAATIANAIFTYGPSLVSAIASIWQEKEHGALTVEQAEARIKEVIDFAEKQKKLDEEAVRDAIGK